MPFVLRFSVVLCLLSVTNLSAAETLRKAVGMQSLLEASDNTFLVQEAIRRGDARRGAIAFHRSAAACAACHSSGTESSPLGPNLAELGRETKAEYLVDALLRPSKDIRKGFETHAFLTSDGQVITGMVVREDDHTITIRPAENLTQSLVLQKDEIEQSRVTTTSMMPDGLVASLRDQREFYDLLRYVIEVAQGGPEVAAALQPSEEELVIQDDSVNLDHAGIIKGMKRRDFDAGEAIYQGYCFDCHGRDGNKPSLPTARAFGTQPMKFGADPYRMFMTLTQGNGLMAPMSHLTPKERYQVVHYIRTQFMEPSNPDFFQVDREYLESLPPGTEDGTAIALVDRDFGPALGSQLRREFPSVLNIQLGESTIAYDLHTMNQADLWQDGFLDLSETQHIRPRGEGTAVPAGVSLTRLHGWRWGHEGSLDYTRDQWQPRGPMPATWMHYHGYYLRGADVILSYRLDGREVLERPTAGPTSQSIQHDFQLGPGEALQLAVAELPRGQGKSGERQLLGLILPGEPMPTVRSADADSTVGVLADGDGEVSGGFVAAGVYGDVDEMAWNVDHQQRLVLRIPASATIRRFSILRIQGQGAQDFQTSLRTIREKTLDASANSDLEAWPQQDDLRWPETMTTIGYVGLQRGAYALDTLTIPESTPWNTWFRTSALDFFPDGRMVVTTYGGDVWVVSGIDDDLLQLRWKRFAAGLYEPFGVRVVDGDVFVTCKDRLIRLHDRDGNGEADFYESFSADDDVSVNFHAFNFDLQTDSEGNFYYAKAGHGADYSLPGAIIKISPDGQQRSVYSTGFRTPNGMGSLPDDRLTASDNQGQWTPASKINLLRPGGFYGWVPTYNIPGKWAPDGGRIDITTVPIPETFDRPLVWMPQEFDNSSGGQLWAGDDRFGPLANHLLHTSFGKGWMSYLMIQDVGDVSQAAIIKLPFDFRTGIMRARVNPRDGQVYATGLQGWNGGGRIGLLENGVQRLRFTGNRELMVTDCQVEYDGLRIEFNLPLDPQAATRSSAFQGEQWDYLWQASYGSDQYLPGTREKGTDPLQIESATLGNNRQSVKLKVSNLQCVDQLRLLVSVRSEDGLSLDEEIYWTINAVPAKDK